jgi:hypothetical protein
MAMNARCTKVLQPGPSVNFYCLCIDRDSTYRAAALQYFMSSTYRRAPVDVNNLKDHTSVQLKIQRTRDERTHTVQIRQKEMSAMPYRNFAFQIFEASV